MLHKKILLVSVCMFVIACDSKGTKFGKEAGDLLCHGKATSFKEKGFSAELVEMTKKHGELRGTEDYLKGLCIAGSKCGERDACKKSKTKNSKTDPKKEERCHTSCTALGAFEKGRDVYNNCHANCMKP